MSSTRRSGRATWLIGLVDGLLLGVLGLEFGIFGLALLLAIAITMIVFRNLPMLSGFMVGAGGIWAALLVRQAILVCNEPGRALVESCPSAGLAAYTLIGAVFVVVGIAVGVIVRRRRPVGTKPRGITTHSGTSARIAHGMPRPTTNSRAVSRQRGMSEPI